MATEEQDLESILARVKERYPLTNAPAAPPQTQQQQFESSLGPSAEDPTFGKPQPRPGLGAAEQTFQGSVIAPFENWLLGKEAAARGSQSDLEFLGGTPGIQFDASEGIGPLGRFMMGLSRNREISKELLMRLPNVQDVTFNSMGEPVVRIIDPVTKKPRDILANPVGIDTTDFMTLMAQAPEIIMGALGARTGVPLRASGIGPVLRQIAQMALGAGVGGFAKDIVTEKVAKGNVTGEALSDIGKERAVQAAVDVATGLVEAGGSKTASKILTPAGTRTPLTIRAEAGRELLNRELGLGLQFTPAEATGNLFLLRSEAYQARKAGGSGPFQHMMADRRDQMQRLQEILLGTTRDNVISEHELGREILRDLDISLAPLDAAIGTESRRTLQNATAEIESSIGRATRVPTPVQQSAAGQGLFDRAERRLAAFRRVDNALYEGPNGVYQHPAIANGGRNIEVTDLANNAQGIINNIASVEREVMHPSAILGPGGTPITMPVTETRPLRSFMDSNVRTRLEELATNAQGGRMSLRDLIRARRDLDDEIARGAIISGVPERDLMQLRGAMTDRIRNGLNEIDPTGDALARWERANTFHATHMGEFKSTGIRELFKEAEDTGVLGLSKVVERAMDNPDMWRNYSRFFGPQSREMRNLRRVYADRIVGNLPGSNIVDMDAFLGRMKNAFTGKSREIAEEVFGQEAANLRYLGTAGSQAEKRMVNADDLARLMVRPGGLTEQSINDLVYAQKRKAAIFNNKILQKIGTGEINPGQISPNELVDYMVFNPETSHRDLAEVIARIADPGHRNQLGQATLMRIFDDATVGPAGREIITSDRLAKYLEPRSDQRSRLQVVLGDDTMRRLDATRDFLAPRDIKEKEFGVAGSIASGMQIGEFEKALLSSPTGVADSLGRMLRSFALSAAYLTRWPGRNYLANTHFAPSVRVPGGGYAGGGTVADTALWTNLLLASTPAVEALYHVFKPEYSRLTALMLKQGIDASAQGGDGGGGGGNIFDQLQALQQQGAESEAAPATNAAPVQPQP
jgi:hypothetical protein